MRPGEITGTAELEVKKRRYLPEEDIAGEIDGKQ